MANNQFEPFFLLKEFQSLDKYISECLNRIKDQQNRILKLNQIKDSREEDFLTHTKELEAFVANLPAKELLNTKLSRDYEQTLASENFIKNTIELKTFESQKTKLESEKNRLDQEIFQLLEKQEELESLIQEDNNFIEGIKKTISEISHEVEQSKSQEYSLIQDYEHRQSLLLENLPVHFKDRFQRIYQNLKGKRPITVARGSNCLECAFLLSRNLLSELDRGETLVTCPNCHRLLLPSSATT